MIDVLLARAGFRDDTSVLRLHHEAGLRVRTHPGGLHQVVSRGITRDPRGVPACIAFTAVEPDSEKSATVEALRALRSAHRHIVCIAFLDAADLSGTARTSACVAYFEAGADDIVSTEIHPTEYAARVHALVRRRGWMELDMSAVCLRPGERPRVDPERRRLLGSLGAESLTAKECIVMRVILESDGLTTRAVIGERLWTDGWYGTKKAIDMHIANLRKKLRATCGSEWSIETVRGTGFVLVPSEREAASTLSG